MLNRLEALHLWLSHCGLPKILKFDNLLGDASLRRYYRITLENQQQYLIMDAPPPHERCQEFISIQAYLKQNGLRVPEIIYQNSAQGFLVIEDFGDRLLLDVLNSENVSQFYQKGMDIIVNMQKAPLTQAIPKFDTAYMLQEMQLFPDWFLHTHLKLNLNTNEALILKKCMHAISEKITEHPQTLIHRDFHSRNLMVLPQDELGIIDFQDAMIGPRTYDLVSLLKDCYIAWPLAQQQAWLSYYHQTQNLQTDFSDLWQEYTLCGIQRHLKVLGIFCRINYRDHKSRYLADLPLVWNYTMTALKEVPWLKPLEELMTEKIEPQFQAMIS